jgi:hypothetical protein
MPIEPATHTAKCHCGAVEFTVRLSNGFATVRRCTCSYCRMRGAVAVSAALDGIHFKKGQEHLASYRFNTGTAQHFFCSICGIYTHHQRRSNQAEFGVNVACLDGITPFDFKQVPSLTAFTTRRIPVAKRSSPAPLSSNQPPRTQMTTDQP